MNDTIVPSMKHGVVCCDDQEHGPHNRSQRNVLGIANSGHDRCCPRGEQRRYVVGCIQYSLVVHSLTRVKPVVANLHKIRDFGRRAPELCQSATDARTCGRTPTVSLLMQLKAHLRISTRGIGRFRQNDSNTRTYSVSQYSKTQNR